ncbi:MAG: TatD family hydrolase [Opitutaceae bacterium]|nr:TatD family hydrolase [Opitutaceae bacterium]
MLVEGTGFFDAHCHLQDERLVDWLSEGGLEAMKEAGIRMSVVNGTRPDDWAGVADLANRFNIVKPSFGLHPWFVNERPSDWKERLEACLNRPNVAVGEIGLDRWIEGHDIEAQMEAFRFQFRLAQSRELPISIHCLRAWGLLHDLLKEEGCSVRGFLLHSYAGPLEMVETFVALGARFSFSGYFASDDKSKKRAAFDRVPLDRLLIESDAPDMLGPEELMLEELRDKNGRPINSPLNLPRIYEYVAGMRNMSLEMLIPVVAENFETFFHR